MKDHPPAEVGDTVSSVDTPALLVDLDALERNIAHLAQVAKINDVQIRPHAKTHKCPAIALKQIDAGAVGICCQKVSEAEAMIEGGITDVLVTNEIVGKTKIGRLVALSKKATIAVCADHPANVTDLNEAASAAGTVFTVLVEVNVGLNRCGVEPGEPAVTLARAITDSSSLRFGGIHAYLGSAQHVREQARRKESAERSVELIQRTVSLLRKHGMSCPTVTGAGSGTYQFEAASGLYTEIQAGSYVFMDGDYAKNLDAFGQPWREFEHSLFVLSSVMSRPNHRRAILDAGLKALTTDSGMPSVVDMDGAEYVRANDEHGYLATDERHRHLGLGQKIRLIPGHCDPTVNLHDWLVAFRGDRVEEVWQITARGALF